MNKPHISNTVNPLYNDICYNSKIHYNDNLVCTKISRLCIFSLTVPCYSVGKHTFFGICKNPLTQGNSNKYTKSMIHNKTVLKVSVIHALDGSISSFFITANSI